MILLLLFITSSSSSTIQHHLINKYICQIEEFTKSTEFKNMISFMSDDYKRMNVYLPIVIYPSCKIPLFFLLTTSLPIYKLPFNKSKIWKRKTYRQTDKSFESQQSLASSSFPILPVLSPFKRCAFLQVLALIPCFLEKEALGRCKMD